MTPADLFRRIVGLSLELGGVPMSSVAPGDIDALMALQDAGKVILTDDPPMIWVNPKAIRGRRKVNEARETLICETDLPPDVPYLKHAPDRDSQPVSGMRLNGEPVYRPRDEPSELILTGSRPWPPEGTEIKPRWYRPARAKWTTEERRDMVVTAEHCPVCGRTESKKVDRRCLVCECWPSNYPTTVRTLEPEPDNQPKPKRKKGAKAS